MNLTDEQKNIIEISKTMKAGEILKINACAGSGKTSTLREIALANPQCSFLYLAFNKTIVEESRNKFPSNVQLKTVHSLAFASVIAPKNAKVIKNYTIFDYMKYLGIDSYQEAQTFGLFLAKFLNSKEKMEYAHYNIARWFNMARNGDIPYTHNLYLKEYELSSNKNNLNRYDFIMLDEAQDTNNVTLSIFINNNCRKILVGDTFQNIYGFRETVNALNDDLLKANYKCDLSYSFRCSQKILNKAFYFLKKYSIDGQKPIWMRSAYQAKDEIKTQALITRLNSSIVGLIDKTLRKKELDKFCLMKDPNALLDSSIAVFWFLKGQIEKIPYSYSWIKNFPDDVALMQYIDESGDQEMKVSYENAINYGYELFDILKEAKRIYNKEGEFETYLLNAHLSKGLEFNEITLFDDFVPLSSNLNYLKANVSPTERERVFDNIIQERNLYYVALTRAKEKVYDRSQNHEEYVSFIAELQKQSETKEEERESELLMR